MPSNLVDLRGFLRDKEADSCCLGLMERVTLGETDLLEEGSGFAGGKGDGTGVGATCDG